MKNKKSCKGALLFLGCAVCIGGCGGKSREVVVIEREPYQRISYETTEVLKGDLEPRFQMTIKAEDYESISYDVTNPELELDTVYVAEGDRVQQGELLVSFRCDSLQQQIKEHQESYEQCRLLAEHYSRLMEIGPEPDYTEDIKLLQEDMQVEELYVEELTEKLADYQIVAKKSGIITGVKEELRNGYFQPGNNQVTEACGSGRYIAEKPADHEFRVGELYRTTADGIECEFRVEEITETQVVFSAVTDLSRMAGREEFSIVIDGEAKKDVVYVSQKAVHRAQEKRFVYVLDDAGYREAVEVTTGETVDGYCVITNGLSGGEKVTLD